jgi:hypothetical protein
LSESDNTDFFTTPEGFRIPGKWKHDMMEDGTTSTAPARFTPDDPLSSLNFSMESWAFADLLPCRLGCNHLVRYHHLVMSDGYDVQFPVNPETGFDDSGEPYIEDQEYEYRKAQSPLFINSFEQIHICHIDSIQYNNSLNEMAFGLLLVTYEAIWNYPDIDESLENIQKKITTPGKTFHPTFSKFDKSDFNAYPGLCIKDSYLDAKEGKSFGFPLLQLIELYIEKESWDDVVKLHSLQSKVFEKFFSARPDLKPENFQVTWNEIGSSLFNKKISDDYSKDSHKEKSLSIESHKEDVDEKVTKMEFELKNYIRKKFPNWDREIPYSFIKRKKEYQKTWGTIANKIRENQMEKSSFAKERLDKLDWLSFGQALEISKFKTSNPHLHNIVNELVDYRNSGEKSHPYETDTQTDPRLLQWVDYKCDQCKKEFGKLDL